ncbi:polyketide synthase [Kitasatospora sp. MMS16-BH015]|uniref:acyl carrier protein n=1 Tax=Kitasatospora sp. MMS16-BH015 TaxID=2018025 RepID=UPI000CA2FBB3|nr:acyl carrier protein [Kitasatospora sp. MMS16-BH015]AUG78208.1 polyketide synthase [Kitasatospora sp. MMS16-BH015]
MSDTITATPQTPAEIRDWLAQRVGYYLERPAADIDGSVPLTQYGLDSVYAFALCGDIEDTLDLPVDPTLVWDVDTVDALSAHLAELIAAR